MDATDSEFVAQHTNGFEAYRQFLLEQDLVELTDAAGIPEAARVANGPGLIACTRMPFGPSSAAT